MNLGIGLAAVAAFLVWVAIVLVGAREGWVRSMPAAKGDSAGFASWAVNRFANQSKGNFAIVLLHNGQVVESAFGSHGQTVDSNSLFQVGSLSKWLTAWGVMSLADQRRIDLDAPVSRYLSRWRLLPSEFDNEDVTVRRLLSHSAGLTDGLGFAGFAPGEKVPTIEEELTKATDALPGRSGVTRVGAAPGTNWRYSGGGYLILQLLIEEVSQEPFNEYMRKSVFLPLGMTRSTFIDPDPANLAEFYARDGTKATHRKFTALGAGSLYTSTADMTRFLQAQYPGPNGLLPGRGVLSPATLKTMRQPQSFVAFGIPIWGLGQILYVPNGSGTYVIGHDGDNPPAINTTARFDPETGDGIIVLETGHETLASEIGGEWTFWHMGTVGLDTLSRFDAMEILIFIALGGFVILIVALVIIRRRRALR